MSRFIDIDDERFWDILFDEACVEGKQAERIKTELEKIVAFDTEKVVEQLESSSNAEAEYYYASSNDVIDRDDAIEIVKGGGVDASGI